MATHLLCAAEMAASMIAADLSVLGASVYLETLHRKMSRKGFPLASSPVTSRTAWSKGSGNSSPTVSNALVARFAATFFTSRRTVSPLLLGPAVPGSVTRIALEWQSGQQANA